MNVIKTEIEGVFIIEPKVFGDKRGYFFESFSERDFEKNVCPGIKFVQDNESKSCYGVVRGLHFQKPPFEQSKLVKVVAGTVLDVAVDLRENSPTYGKYIACELSDDNHRQMFIPRGFAHGFSVLSDEAIFQYKCDNFYAPESEGAIAWNDPDLAIDWKLPKESIILSEKDKHHPMLKDLQTKPAISIIVPVYNAQPYLARCIDSIRNQTLKDFELLLIDDGSTDDSGNLCDEYAAKDPRIKVIHKQNGGLSDTRNTGIGLASANIIGFVDSDDWIDPDMFSTLYGLMIEHNADISICDFYFSYKNKEKIYNKNIETIVYDGNEALKEIIDDKAIKSYVCNKLFKKKVITEPMPVSYSFEDYATTFKWFANAEKVVHITKPLYHYRQRVGSIVHGNDPNKEYHLFVAECERVKYLKTHKLLNERTRELEVKVIKTGIQVTKDIIRKGCNDDVSKPFIDKILSTLTEFMPVRMSEIGLKPYFRLTLLQSSYGTFKALMRIGGSLANNKTLKNREFYE